TLTLLVILPRPQVATIIPYTTLFRSDRRGRQGRQRRRQRRHRGGEDAGQQQARDAGGQAVDDEVREDLVIAGQAEIRRQRVIVVGPQGQADGEEDRELDEHDHAG